MRFALILFSVALPLFAPSALLADPVVNLPISARGNEPGWSVTLDEGLMVFRGMDGSRIDATAPIVHELDSGATKFSTALAVTLTPGVCRDSMSGMPHPMTASVEVGGQTLTGCGGAPADVLAGEWVVTRVGGAEVESAMSVTIGFDQNGGVFGGSGCNRFFGTYTLTGEGLTFGTGLGGTKMMCEDAQMKIEQSFLVTLPKVTSFDIDVDGALMLKAGGDAVLTAKR